MSAAGVALERECTLKGHSDRVWACGWSPSGELLATCSADTKVRLWRRSSSASAAAAAAAASAPAPTWTCVDVLDGVHTRTVRRVVFSPDGKRLATCGFDGLTAVWERTGDGFKWVASLEGHEHEVKCVAWSSSGDMLATCSRDKSVWIWEVGPEGDYECLSVLNGHSGDVKALCFEDGSERVLFSASYDNTIKVWHEEEDDWYCVQTLMEHSGTVWSVKMAHDMLVSCSADQSVCIWTRDAKNKSRWALAKRVADIHTRAIYSVSIHPSLSLAASAGGDNAVCLIDLAEGVVRRRVDDAHAMDINDVAWSADGSMLATASDDFTAQLWRFSGDG